jgi:drug/metabolite transporter (DMT)-like permease
VSTSRYRLLAAFLAVYIIWGSTYLAIRFAIETLPPFLMAGVRFIIAGSILYGWARYRGESKPTRTHWLVAAAIGALLLVGGNGGVVWAEQRVPSGLAALLIATEPFWIVLLDWIRPGGSRPRGPVVLGLLFGFIGVGLLISPFDLVGGGRVDSIGAIAVILASLAWATGSLWTARGATLPSSPMLATGMQMLLGGGMLLLLGSGLGEWSAVKVDAMTLKSLLALLYLIIFGALIGFTAYVYLLQHTTPALASTYAYVNPVIAVFLGWALGGEALSQRIFLAGAAIITAVMIITRNQASHKTQSSAATPARPAAPRGMGRAPRAPARR